MSTALVKHGAPPLRLTPLRPDPNAPITVINLGTERVWLSDDSTAVAGDGVPLEGGTPTRWVTPGDLFALADPANDSDSELVLTSAVSDYLPSPYALATYGLAAQMAAALAGETLEVDASGHLVEVDASGHVVPIDPGTLDTDTAAAIAAAGVPINQAAGLLLNLINKAITGGSSTPYQSAVIDGLGRQTITIFWTAGTDTTGNQWTMELQWFNDAAGTQVVQVETVSSYDALTSTNGAAFTWSKQAKSRYFAIQVTSMSGHNGSFNMHVVGYSGQRNKDQFRAFGDAYLCFLSSVALAAGAASSFVMTGANDQVNVALTTGGGVAANKIAVELFALADNSGFGEIPIGVLQNSGRGPANTGNNQVDVLTLAVPSGLAIKAVVFNGDSVSRSPTVAITDVSNP